MLIVFEGLHGCGKSTQLKKVKKWLDDSKTSNVITEWNSVKELNDFNSYLKETDFYTSKISCLIHALDFFVRYESVIKSNLLKETIILSDRYTYTGFVRERLRGLSTELLNGIYNEAVEPDIIFYFDLSPEESIRRGRKISSRSNYILGADLNYNNDITENFRMFLEKQREMYKELLDNKKNVVTIDANLSENEIFDQIVKRLKYEGL